MPPLAAVFSSSQYIICFWGFRHVFAMQLRSKESITRHLPLGELELRLKPMPMTFDEISPPASKISARVGSFPNNELFPCKN